MLVTRDVVKQYLGKVAVAGVSFDIEPGKIYALLGPNGSGKTTWMKMVAGLIKPTQGTITYNDVKIGSETKKKIAYMSTEPFFYNYMSVKNVGDYYQDFFQDFDMDRYQELIKKMGLGMNDKAKNLSSGLAAKLKIAATLSRKAEVYLLDEPLNGVDIIAREHILQLIMEAHSHNATLIISSHLVDELEKIIDGAIFIKQGKLVLAGEADTIRSENRKSIVDLYKEIYADVF